MKNNKTSLSHSEKQEKKINNKENGSLLVLLLQEPMNGEPISVNKV